MNTAKFFSKLSIALILLFIINIPNSYAMSFEKKFEFCQITSLWLPALFENAGVSGRDICSVSGGSTCSYVNNIGQGICYAGGGGGTICPYVNNIGQGICYAGGGGGTICPYVNNIGQGICYAGGGGGTICPYVNNIAQGICYASKGTNCSYANSISDELCKIAGICNTNNIIDIINGVVGVCGTKVLHYGFSR